MNTKRKSSISTIIIMSICAVLFIVEIVAGSLLMTRSIGKMKAIIQTKIMEISQTAAAFLDGDEIKSLTIADKENNTEKYSKPYNILSLFKTNNVDDNAGLAYIYCMIKLDDGRIVFSVDPSDDPAVFLEEEAIVTDALLKAFEGTTAFDADSYVDRWGDLYSAYSPIFGADGVTVQAVVGVDIWASWYKTEVISNAIAIGVIVTISIGIAIFSTVFLTKKMRQRLHVLSRNMYELQGDVRRLIKDIRDPEYIPNLESSDNKKEDGSLLQLKEQINDTKLAIKNYIEYAHHQAYIDSLTELGNRNAYFAVVEDIEQKIKNDEYLNFAVLVFDINGMKNINDMFSHEAGDKALILCGECLKEIFGEKISYRIGGDELAVIYQNVYEKTIQNKIIDFKKSVENKNNTENLEFVLSISCGYSFFDKNKDIRFQDVFNRADEKMYEEKSKYYIASNVKRTKNRKPKKQNKK